MEMCSYKSYKEKALQNPEVKAEYDELQPEYDIIQADISRIENGTRNPSLSMVKKLAQEI
jgi:predicted transcriptional regulator